MRSFLELAIGNILENAIKYSDNQIVRIIMRQQADHLVIEILDQGIGIPQQDIQNIKQNFFRGQNTHHYSGKGVGLSIANIIFTLHKIDLSIESSGKGTRFISDSNETLICLKTVSNIGFLVLSETYYR